MATRILYDAYVEAFSELLTAALRNTSRRSNRQVYQHIGHLETTHWAQRVRRLLRTPTWRGDEWKIPACSGSEACVALVVDLKS